MLADPKTKPSWVLNPRASGWSQDQNKLGQKMLEKMGWSAGKGLGAREQGQVEAIRITYKGDTRGFGTGRKKEQEDWLKQQESFQSLLEQLNGSDDKSVRVKSLEEKSKTTRTKIHYHKFARGKDISRYSEKDLSCIVGSGFVPVKLPETNSTDVSAPLEQDTEDESMNAHHSRSGRVLKPTFKVAEEEKPPEKKKRKKDETVTLSSGESKGKDKAAGSSKQNLSPKRNKPIKEKSSSSGPKVESSENSEHEHSRSGRIYKPSAKAKLIAESSPSKKKRIEELEPKESEQESTTGGKQKTSPKKNKLNKISEQQARDIQTGTSSKDSSISQARPKRGQGDKSTEVAGTSSDTTSPTTVKTKKTKEKLEVKKNKLKKMADTASVDKSEPEEVEVPNTKNKKRKGNDENVNDVAISSPKKKTKPTSEVETDSTRKSSRKWSPSKKLLDTMEEETNKTKPRKGKLGVKESESNIHTGSPIRDLESGQSEGEEDENRGSRKQSKKGMKNENEAELIDTSSTSNDTSKKIKDNVAVTEVKEDNVSKKKRKRRKENMAEEPEVESKVAEESESKTKKKKKMKEKVYDESGTFESGKNGKVVCEQELESGKKKSKRDKKKKAVEADNVRAVDDGNIESSVNKRKKKKKVEVEDEEEETVVAKKAVKADNAGVVDDGNIESPVKKMKKKKKVEEEEEETAAAKTKRRPATTTDRQESSESQETAISAEELASANSQSSFILEMIPDTPPDDLSPIEEPEELKKYHILTDSDPDDQN